MLTFDRFGVCSGRKEILQDVSFSVRRGRITVLLGKNGAGKSTLLRCVNGLLPYTGCIYLGGREIKTISFRERSRQICFFHQILPRTGFTVHSLVSLGRSPYTGPTGRLSDADLEAVEKAMDTAQVKSLADRRVDTLSGGEKQRAFLAMLLAQDTPLLMMDEPAAYLDTDARRHLLQMLRDLVDIHGKTLLLVLHDLTDALEIADDVVILAERTSVFTGSRAQCLDSGMVGKWFGVRRYFCTDEGGARMFFR
ncbi:MAG: ABC transporter ATP-binding protein [Clostridia bacterium]|nr:ABC transporter ATP-binding protein [Clostridia bacterium]